MTLNDLANLGQIIGAVAVVVSLIYVALQIRQNTNAVRSAAAQVVHEHFASWYHLLANDAELSQNRHTRCKADGRLQHRSAPNRCCVEPLLTGKESNEST